MILEKIFLLSLSPSLIPLPTSQLLSSLLLIHHPLPPAFSLSSSLIHAVMQVNGLNLHYQSCCSLPQFHPPSLETSPFRAWILDPHLQESAGSLLHPEASPPSPAMWSQRPQLMVGQTLSLSTLLMLPETSTWPGWLQAPDMSSVWPPFLNLRRLSGKVCQVIHFQPLQIWLVHWYCVLVCVWEIKCMRKPSLSFSAHQEPEDEVKGKWVSDDKCSQTVLSKDLAAASLYTAINEIHCGQMHPTLTCWLLTRFITL